MLEEEVGVKAILNAVIAAGAVAVLLCTSVTSTALTCKIAPPAAWKSEAVAEVAVHTWSALAVSLLFIALLFNVVIAIYYAPGFVG